MDEVVPSRGARPELRREAIASLLRLLLGFGAFLLAVTIVSWTFHEELERLGSWFIECFGPAGMALGAFLADGLHFPLPPQFYLFAGVAGGFGRELAIGSVLGGSILGGLMTFALWRRASKLRVLRNRFRQPRRAVERLVGRHGYWGLVIAGLLPLSYWLLCSMAGLLGLPYRAYGVLAIMRVPRIVLSYLLIALAWQSSSP